MKIVDFKTHLDFRVVKTRHGTALVGVPETPWATEQRELDEAWKATQASAKQQEEVR